MRSLQRAGAERAFYKVLEDSPPAHRLLLAFNPPTWATTSDVRVLVAKSFAMRYSAQEGMRHFAEVGCALAQSLRGRGADLQGAKGEAFLQLGNALRIKGNFSASRDAFARAEAEISRGPEHPSLLANLWELKGALYRDCRQFSLAERCLSRAARLHAASEDLSRIRCLISRALCAGESGDAKGAVRRAERAILAIEGNSHTELAFTAIHVMCWFLVDLNDAASAHACLVEAEDLLERLPVAVFQNQLWWLRARVDHALGLYESAEILYRRAALGLEGHFSYDRALLLLEFCRLLVALRRRKELFSTAADILPVFKQTGLRRELGAARRFLSLAS